MAQETIYDEKVGLYSLERSGGLILHTSGFGANYRHGKYVTGSRIRIYEVQVKNVKHPKEQKVFPLFENSRGFYFGKIRSFYVLQPSIGYKKIIFDKIRAKGVEVRYAWLIGPTLGFTKPIFLEVRRNEVSTSVIVNEQYDPERHHQTDIYGRSRGLHGFGAIKFHPGLQAKFGLSFEYSGLDDYIRTVEAGVSLDAYTGEIPIMALERNRQFFLSLYVNLLYGKKYSY